MQSVAQVRLHVDQLPLWRMCASLKIGEILILVIYTVMESIYHR